MADHDIPPKTGYGRGLAVLVVWLLLMTAIAGFWLVLLPQAD